MYKNVHCFHYSPDMILLTRLTAETTKNKIKYSHKQFQDYLKNECDSAIFLQPKEKIALLILIRNLSQIVYLIEYS